MIMSSLFYLIPYLVLSLFVIYTDDVWFEFRV